MADTSTAFIGPVPALYDRCLVPLLFEPFALDLAGRAAASPPADILETAAGTGVVTRMLVRACPAAAVVATDLNQAMLDVAAEHEAGPRVTYRQADAQALPFADGSFDLVACQFGVMFFPDRAAAFAEARRVLRPGGRLVFNVWDRLERNPVSHAAQAAVAALFPGDPPDFFARVPFACHDTDLLERELEAAGFAQVRVEQVVKRSRVAPEDAALGLCGGSPLRAEIEARRPGALAEAVAAATDAIARLVGHKGGDAPMSALVVSAS